MTQAELMGSIKSYLGAYAEFRKVAGDAVPPTIDEWVYERGREMTERVILPERVVHEGSNECYLNAWRYKVEHPKQRLRYCEGFLMIENCPIPVMHGWLLDQPGWVVDPSVNQKRAAAYFGVEFKDAFAHETWRELRTPKIEGIGILGNLWRLDITKDKLEKGIK